MSTATPLTSNAAPPRRVIVAVTLLAAFHVAQGAWVILADRSLPHFAVLDHQGRAIALHLGLSRADRTAGPGAIVDVAGMVLRSSSYRQPLLFVGAQPAFWLLGPTADASALTILPWTLLLVLGTFRLGRRLGGDSAGLVSAATLMAFPIVLGHRALFLPFLPMAACASMAAAEALELARERPRAHWRLGLWVGIGLLVRADFALVAVGLGVGALLEATAGRRAAVFRSLLRAVGATLLVSGWWFAASGLYAIHFYMGIGILRAEHPHDGIPLVSVANLVYYPLRLATMMAGPLGVVAALALAGLVRARATGARLFLAWIVVPWAFYTVIPLKSARYLVPALPALAVALSLAVHRTGCTWLRRLLVALALATPLVLVHVPGAAAAWSRDAIAPSAWCAVLERREDALDYGRIAPWSDPSWERLVDDLTAMLLATTPVAEEIRGDPRGAAPDRTAPAKHRAYVVDGVADLYLEPLDLDPRFEVGRGCDLALRDLALARRKLRDAKLLLLAFPPATELAPRALKLVREAHADAAGRPRLGELALPDGRALVAFGPRS